MHHSNTFLSASSERLLAVQWQCFSDSLNPAYEWKHRYRPVSFRFVSFYSGKECRARCKELIENRLYTVLLQICEWCSALVTISHRMNHEGRRTEKGRAHHSFVHSPQIDTTHVSESVRRGLDFSSFSHFYVAARISDDEALAILWFGPIEQTPSHLTQLIFIHHRTREKKTEHNTRWVKLMTTTMKTRRTKETEREENS